MAVANVASTNEKDIWKLIEQDFAISKKAFGKRIAFVQDPFKRTVIFRDVAHAYILAQSGFNKPAVILSGSVIEELLRLFIVSKGTTPSGKTFVSYIETCQRKGLLKISIQNVSTSVRQFRNIVHLELESSSRETISKPTAKAAVALIFTIANDFR